MPTQYQLEQVRKKARAAGKIPASDKKKTIYKSPKTNRQRAQEDINQYKLDSYGKSSTSTTTPKSTATSGGSKAVRKIDPRKKSLVDRLRDKPFKYIR